MEQKSALILMMNIYWLKLFLTDIQGDMGDSERGCKELDKQLSLVIDVQKSCTYT